MKSLDKAARAIADLDAEYERLLSRRDKLTAEVTEAESALADLKAKRREAALDRPAEAKKLQTSVRNAEDRYDLVCDALAAISIRIEDVERRLSGAEVAAEHEHETELGRIRERLEADLAAVFPELVRVHRHFLVYGWTPHANLTSWLGSGVLTEMGLISNLHEVRLDAPPTAPRSTVLRRRDRDAA